MGVYIDGVDMPKGETTELIIRVQPNGEIRDSQGILLKLRAEDIDLVRCGECKYWDGIECQNDRASTDLEGGAEYALYRDDTDFCSYGERKE